MKKSRPLVGANLATTAALPFHSARTPSRREMSASIAKMDGDEPPVVAAPVMSRTLTVSKGATAVRLRPPAMDPATRCVSGDVAASAEEEDDVSATRLPIPRR